MTDKSVSSGPEREYRNPWPTVVFFALFLVGSGAVWYFQSVHRIDEGPAISLTATWWALLFFGEAVWDAFQKVQDQILHEPRSIPLPPWLDWTKRFWPLAAFGVGVFVGHQWWW